MHTQARLPTLQHRRFPRTVRLQSLPTDVTFNSFASTLSCVPSSSSVVLKLVTEVQ
jgi:hypothetical protein